MSKIHSTVRLPVVAITSVSEHSAIWTVWKKWSMTFQGTDGFSVYDNHGRLAFMVDNYSRRNKFLSGELILMDGEGRDLLALRPQMISMHDRWNGFEANQSLKPASNSLVFSMRKRLVVQQSDDAYIFMGQSSAPSFAIDGCFRKRSCRILDSSGNVVAEISPKKLSNSVQLGNDVFCLIIHPGVDSQLMVALVVVLDRICQKTCNPLLCFPLIKTSY